MYISLTCCTKTYFFDILQRLFNS